MLQNFATEVALEQSASLRTDCTGTIAFISPFLAAIGLEAHV